jgi:hypothetical protein
MASSPSTAPSPPAASCVGSSSGTPYAAACSRTSRGHTSGALLTFLLKRESRVGRVSGPLQTFPRNREAASGPGLAPTLLLTFPRKLARGFRNLAKPLVSSVTTTRLVIPQPMIPPLNLW